MPASLAAARTSAQRSRNQQSSSGLYAGPDARSRSYTGYGSSMTAGSYGSNDAALIELRSADGDGVDRAPRAAGDEHRRGDEQRRVALVGRHVLELQVLDQR